MTRESGTVASWKGQLSKFSGIISKRFKKPKRKLFKEMLYWIQASKDVKLSNISKTLKEDQPLLKTEDRLSRNLDDEDFTDSISAEILRLGGSKVTEGMVSAIDPEDLPKKYAKKMEFWARVRDGSEKEIGDGYPLCKAATTDIESKKVIPLYCEAYSFLAEGVKSENSQLSKMIDLIFEHTADRGIHAMDRDGDRGVLYKKYPGDKKAKQFVIRLVDRDLIHQGRRRNCCDMAKALPTPYETV